jgi:hypothetical protein
MASQNVAQLLLNMMNHTGFKWLPKCGIITADCDKLHRTQVASQNVAQLLPTHESHKTKLACQNVAQLLLTVENYT